MSLADIADNRWEAESIKPPVKDAAGITQMLMMVTFSLIFLFMLIGAIIGAFSSDKGSDLERRYREMNAPAATTPAAVAPAATTPAITQPAPTIPAAAPAGAAPMGAPAGAPPAAAPAGTPPAGQ